MNPQKRHLLYPNVLLLMDKAFATYVRVTAPPYEMQIGANCKQSTSIQKLWTVDRYFADIIHHAVILKY